MSAAVVPPKPAPRPGRVMVYRAVIDYTAKNEKELTFCEGDLLYVSDELQDGSSDWFSARCGSQVGLIPKSYLLEAVFIPYPLHDAAKRGNIQFVRECISNSVSVNSLDKSGSTALYWASHSGHASVVELLIAVPNVCISAQNKIGDTALHAAAWKGHSDCIRLLLNNGACTSLRNNDRMCPIDLARDVNCRALIHMAMRGIDDSVDNEYLSESDEEEMQYQYN